MLDRTAKATKIGKTTIKAIAEEYRGQGKFESPAKRFKVKMNLPELQLDARYTTFIPPKNTLFLINCLKSYMTKTFSMVVAVHSQRYFKKTMGFRYKTREDGKQYVYKQPRVIQQRHDYLRRMKRNRVDKRPEVFLDETWLNSHAAPERLCDGSGGSQWERATPHYIYFMLAIAKDGFQDVS